MCDPKGLGTRSFWITHEVVCPLISSTSDDLFWYSRVRYNERSYNERMLQRKVFISKIRMLQLTRRNNIGRRSTRVRMTCRAFPLLLERQSSSLLCV